MDIIAYLAEEIANILGTPIDTVAHCDFDDLGLTSVNMTEIVEQLSLTFPTLPITILYEYKNLQALVEYLQSNYPDVFATKFQNAPGELSLEETQLSQPKLKMTDIAIIGMAGYLPGASNLEAFWELLLKGQTSFTEVPKDRWNMDVFYSPDETKSGYSYTKWGAFLKDIDKFDPLLFNISPKDAAKIDPQERLFLQASYTALEDSGYIHLLNETHAQSVGIFVGVTNASYGWLENDHDSWRKIKHVNVSSAYWSIANRVSYTFNFSGPSLSIDTACSSSLSALHLACESLMRGECAYSIVGGVNLILHPRQFTELSEMKMLSRGDQNKTFSDEADGFVYGEGVVSLVLKPFQQALDDEDPIYAVIKSTSINTNGKTSGYTVPSPNAQAALITHAIDKSGYTAADIQYVECHGTGTKLGDPIEIRGLTKAFESTNTEKQHCLLGSVKMNIGHLESAAGLAGVLKAALQITHQRITPSVLVEPLNKKIDFSQTPFTLVKEPQSWPRESSPLLTCVSSFGAGGANAHAILSNNPTQPKPKTSPKEQVMYLVGISANHPQALRQKLEELYAWLQSCELGVCLGDVVYTLNNHRLHYAHRMAFIFNEIELLKQQCLDVIINEMPLNYYSNSLSIHKPLDELGADAITPLMANGPTDAELHSIAISYVNGVEIQWKELYKKEDYHFLKLPSYPFLKERCWITDEFMNQVTPPLETQHPFISEFHFEDKSCVKLFSGDHYTFDDHVLKGEKIFPGVCHLEMVYEAFRHIYNASPGVLSEITWLLPMDLLDDRCDATLRFIENGNNLSYQLGKKVNGTFLLCSQGKISATKKELPPLDLSNYKLKITEEMSGDELYSFFRENGWYHGPAFQSVHRLYLNDEMLVGEIQVPDFFNARNEDYGLNPGVMDGILQAITILNRRLSTSDSIALPFYLQSLEVIKPLATKVEVLVTIDESKKRQKNKQYDVLVADLDGSICLKLSGFIMALIQESISQDAIQYYAYQHQQTTLFDNKQSGAVSYSKIVMMEKRSDGRGNLATSDIAIMLQEGLIRIEGQEAPFLLDNEAECLKLIHYLKQTNETYHLINFVDINSEMYGSLRELVSSYISFLQKLLKERLPIKYIFSCEFLSTQLGSLGACLTGFYKSLHAENSSISACHLIIDESYRNTDDLIEKISLVLNHHEHCPELHLTPEGFSYLALTTIKSVEPKPVFKQGGVYLLSGGMGGLGRLLTNYLIKEFDAQVILLGRSEIDDEKNAFLNRCNQTNNRVFYYQANSCNQVDLEVIYRQIKVIFPYINGVFNLAASSKDNYFIQQDLNFFESTCATKINSSLCLDGVLTSEPLDFFVVFSSIASVLGNRGQSDYAAANAWLDRFASNRNHYVQKNLRYGRTISISWPYITEGGFQLEKTYLEWMKEQWGMMGMSGEKYLNALSAALTSQAYHLMPFIGKGEQLVSYYQKTCLPTKPIDTELLSIVPQQTQELEQEIIQLIATHQKIKLDDLNVETDLTTYGYSSIGFTELSSLINEKYAIATTPAIFFDATCVRDLCNLLVEDYPDVFKPHLDKDLVVETKSYADEERLNPSAQFDDPIAIIGHHARFPGAESMDEYWSNLKHGVHSISEIPALRWNWKDIYGDPQEGDFTRSKWGGFIEGIDQFDARFFGISPREAELMDPQQRIFLESVYHAMEHAGYTKDHFSAHTTGLYVGVSLFEYGKLLQQYADLDAYTSSGTVHSIVANRVSYQLGLTGPSIALDTACSSSLVAIHEAVKALRYGDCELAIAGGVNALIEPSFYIAFDKAGMLSPDGKCSTFDKSANGYVRGEGVATLILKPLSKALRDKDSIYGVIRGSGINHGGHAQTMTSPNPKAQAELIIDTFQKAKIPFNTIQYIECHGTGTPLGDPVEVNGLKKAYQALKQNNAGLQHDVNCGIGSVKTNIGHLESSSGVAGVLKVLLMMQNKTLVKTLNFSELNPYIDLSNTPFYVVDENKPWFENITKEGDVVPIRAAVSGFGFGGANAHVILEMPPVERREFGQTKPLYLITLSAVFKETLDKKVQDLMDWLQTPRESQQDTIEAISFTLNQGREHFKHRFACVVSSQKALLNILTDYKLTQSTAQVILGDSTTSPSLQKAVPADIYQQLLISRSDKNAYQALILRLAEHYVQGAKIDWLQLHAEEGNCRTALPVYPFMKKTYWFTKKVSSPVINQLEPNLNHYCYTNEWEKFSFKPFSLSKKRDHAPVVVYFDKDVFDTFQHSFSADARQFVLIEDMKIGLNNCIKIDKSDVFSYMDAFSSIEVVDVVYFICPQKQLEDDLSHEYLTCFYRLIKSMLQKRDVITKMTLKIISFGITNPSDAGQPLAVGAGIQGFAKTLANEFLEWQVDQYDFAMDTRHFPADIHQSLSFSGSLCLYRNNEWHYQRLVTQELNNSKPSALKKMGTYLIVGGLGGIGSVLTDYLTTHYNARVIIVGRKALQEVEEKYRPYYFQCDISQEDAVIALHERLLESYPNINGIFQCAMVLKDQSIRHMSEIHLNNVIKPKGQGTYHLLNIMGGFVDDFIAIFSSTASYFALAGQSNYTAASWLQDQVAEAFYRDHKKIKLIHWGLWEEAGAVSDKHYQQALHQLGFVGIKNKDAMKLLELALANATFDITLLGINHHAKDLYPILNTPKQQKDPFLVLNEQAVQLLWAAFNEKHFWTEKNAFVSHQQLFALSNATTLSRSMLMACLALLEKTQFISYQTTSSGYTSLGQKNHSLAQAIAETKQEILQYPELKPFLEAMILTSSHLFEFLNGDTNAIALMCPDGDLSLLDSFYSNNPVVHRINEVVSKKVKEVVLAKLTMSNLIRIIEVGAGCGGTTKAIFELLKDKNSHIEYVYTDVSSAFIANAKKSFAHHSNIKFKLLDIEANDLILEAYDVVIASNVLHTTKDIKHTLNNCKRFLNEKGVLIINEVTSAQDFLTLVFGMFSGWWAFQDSYRIPNSPLISKENWALLLRETGFNEVVIENVGCSDPHTLIYAINDSKPQLNHTINLSQSFHKIDAPMPSSPYNTALKQSKHERMIDILSKVLKFSPDEINPSMSFADLGLDSITGVSFISKVNKEFGTHLPVNIIFSHKNIVELADKIKEPETPQPLTENQSLPVFLFED